MKKLQITDARQEILFTTFEGYRLTIKRPVTQLYAIVPPATLTHEYLSWSCELHGVMFF